MSVIQIRKAKREGARLVVGLSGVSSSGKTHTALLLALGLAKGDPNKIGFIDTENRRGSLYADIFTGPEFQGRNFKDSAFLIGDLYPPFSPQRYIDAIQQFQAAGVEVLIIDSATHEWEGQGGAQEIAEAGNPRMPNWNKAKAEHKRFMNAALQCDMHIIFCVRAREKAKPERVQKDGKTVIEYQDMGLQPIQEKNFMFEMTVSAMIHDQGTRREILKCPAPLREVFETSDKYIGEKQGKALREWVDGANQLDSKVESWRNRLLSNTEQGAAHIETCWNQTPAAIRDTLGNDFYNTLKSSAQEFDKQRAEAAAAQPPSLAAPAADPASALGAPAAQAAQANDNHAQPTEPAKPAARRGRPPKAAVDPKPQQETAPAAPAQQQPATQEPAAPEAPAAAPALAQPEQSAPAAGGLNDIF